jgi:hypothetical protein
MSATISIRTSHIRTGDGSRFAPSPVRRAGSCRPTEATYRRRRFVVGVVLAVFVAVGAVLAHDVLVGSGGEPASAAASRPARVRPSVVARPGDTLWSIAEVHHGEVPISRYVDVLVDLNGGASIQAGQAVVLP